MKKLFFLLILLMFTINTTLADTGKNINIVYTIDDNYPIFTLLSINSILRNNVSDSNFSFYIIENNLTKKNKKKMENFISNRGQKIQFINIHQPLLEKETHKIYTYCNYITSIGLARIYIDKLLPAELEKVLYLDADTLVISDISELYNQDLDGYYLGMVKNISSWARVGQYSIYDKNYYNSGVILIDLNKLRKFSSSEKMERFYEENIIKFDNNEFLLPDQDVINIVLNGKIKELNKKWNQQLFKEYNKGIIHYITEKKPWAFRIIKNGKNRKEVKLYLNYWKNCPELSMYRHYYFVKGLVDQYKEIVRIKFDFYKKIMLKNKS